LWRQWVPASGKFARKITPGKTIKKNCRENRKKTANKNGKKNCPEKCPKLPRMRPRILGTMPHAMNWLALCAGSPALTLAKESTMRNRILAIAAIAGALSAPIAAQAQSDTVGIVRGGTVIINDDEGIAVDQRPAFREYIVRERVPNYTIPDRVIVGGVLPETGVTYYDVPQTYGVTPYRYTVVNGRTVLVEPRTRRIVQVVE
jgi:hypothetical protein